MFINQNYISPFQKKVRGIIKGELKMRDRQTTRIEAELISKITADVSREFLLNHREVFLDEFCNKRNIRPCNIRYHLAKREFIRALNDCFIKVIFQGNMVIFSYIK